FQADQPVFGESFSLRQIYIEPRANIKERQPVGDNKPSGEFESVLQHTSSEIWEVVPLLDEITHWIKARDKEKPIRVISGGPGSGKSSFAKILADRLANDETIDVLLIPLHQVDVKMDLISAVGAFVEAEGFLTENPIRQQNSSAGLVLILDGLDELEMQGRGAQEAAEAFVREVDRDLQGLNFHHLRVQALITGRELAVQTVEWELRRPRQVLHMLPYFVPENERHRYRDPGKLLETDQRQIWWKNYGGLT